MSIISFTRWLLTICKLKLKAKRRKFLLITFVLMAMAFSSLVSTHCKSRDQDADAVPVDSLFSRCCRWLHRSGTICTKDLAAQLANTTHHSITASQTHQSIITAALTNPWEQLSATRKQWWRLPNEIFASALQNFTFQLFRCLTWRVTPTKIRVGRIVEKVQWMQTHSHTQQNTTQKAKCIRACMQAAMRGRRKYNTC